MISFRREKQLLEQSNPPLYRPGGIAPSGEEFAFLIVQECLPQLQSYVSGALLHQVPTIPAAIQGYHRSIVHSRVDPTRRSLYAVHPERPRLE